MSVAQYDAIARRFMEAKEKTYATRPSTGTLMFYSAVDFPLKGKRLLDVGCGYGAEAEHFRQRGARVWGIDSSKEMIRLAKERYPLIDFSVQDMRRTAFDSGFFDVVVSRCVFHYAKSLDQLFREMHRLLKPGGWLVFTALHPVLQFMVKKRKNYFKQEIVRLELFKGVFVTEPSHNFGEYLSDFVTRNFDVASFRESEIPSKRVVVKEIVPSYFMLKLRKKSDGHRARKP